MHAAADGRRHLRRPRGGHAATSRSATPTGCAPRPRSSPTSPWSSASTCEQGDVLGTTAGRLHFSARAATPTSTPRRCSATGPPRVRLVPFDEPPGRGRGGRALRDPPAPRARRRCARRRGRGRPRRPSTRARGRRVGRRRRDELARLALEYGAAASSPLLRTALLVRTTLEVARRGVGDRRRGPCTDGRRAPSRRRRSAASRSWSAGSAPPASTAPSTTSTWPRSATTPATWCASATRAGAPRTRRTGSPGVDPEPVRQAETRSTTCGRARPRLADLLEEVAAPRRRRADRRVSPTRRAASSAGWRSSSSSDATAAAWLERLGLFATLGTPARRAPTSPPPIRRLGRRSRRATWRWTRLRARVRARRRRARRGPAERDAPTWSGSSPTTRCPTGSATVSVAARGDLVVPVPRARFEGAREVGGAPGRARPPTTGLPGDPGTTRELALALAGAPPACTSFVRALPTRPSGRPISCGRGRHRCAARPPGRRPPRSAAWPGDGHAR